ncbi:hypothetical protein CBR_g3770 [Chara braunii]|uniref:Uncharacterized protein n=1 Tax=Chara braunii TaxID=69332 RepID=A0A388KGA3_CHABU|nr:hypothetical protein CBR_g3770 [Chara braunii]|eukprot:GBG69071.1 hypothetical protein CBR_g3770 [Chara braunii]
MMQVRRSTDHSTCMMVTLLTCAIILHSAPLLPPSFLVLPCACAQSETSSTTSSDGGSTTMTASGVGSAEGGSSSSSATAGQASSGGDAGSGSLAGGGAGGSDGVGTTAAGSSVGMSAATGDGGASTTSTTTGAGAAANPGQSTGGAAGSDLSSGSSSQVGVGGGSGGLPASSGTAGVSLPGSNEGSIGNGQASADQPSTFTAVGAASDKGAGPSPQTTTSTAAGEQPQTGATIDSTVASSNPVPSTTTTRSSVNAGTQQAEKGAVKADGARPSSTAGVVPTTESMEKNAATARQPNTPVLKHPDMAENLEDAAGTTTGRPKPANPTQPELKDEVNPTAANVIPSAHSAMPSRAANAPKSVAPPTVPPSSSMRARGVPPTPSPATRPAQIAAAERAQSDTGAQTSDNPSSSGSTSGRRPSNHVELLSFFIILLWPSFVVVAARI